MEQSSINQFNKLADVYDWLAKIFIGEVIRDAQRQFLHEICDAKDILILGGGTGWILKDIQAHNTVGRILYVEASSSMIDRAREFDVAGRTTFLHGTELDLPHDLRFDAVITNFYLDLFSEKSLTNKIRLIKSMLNSHGKWLVTDFVYPRKIKHRILLWIMYQFFRFTTNIEATSLPSWQNQLKEQELILKDCYSFKNDFIQSMVLSK